MRNATYIANRTKNKLCKGNSVSILEVYQSNFYFSKYSHMPHNSSVNCRSTYDSHIIRLKSSWIVYHQWHHSQHNSIVQLLLVYLWCYCYSISNTLPIIYKYSNAIVEYIIFHNNNSELCHWFISVPYCDFFLKKTSSTCCKRLL